MALKKSSRDNLVYSILSNEEFRLVDIRHVDDAKLEISNLKRQADGFTAIGIKEALDIWHQWHIPNSELSSNITKLVGREDVYISINSMLSPLRQLKNLRHLHGFWVDLDYYKIKRYKNKSTDEMIEILRKNKMFDEVEPSFFMDSGNGMYIFYLIESATIKALPIWQKIQNAFLEKFKKYGADPQSIDAVHVLRLAGTKNTKTHRFSKFVFNSDAEYRFEAKEEPMRIYTINELSEIMLPALPHSKEEWENIKKSKKQTKKIVTARKEVALYNLHTLHYSRIKDLEALQDLRQGDCKGHRELMCFLYRYYSYLFIKNEESALANLMAYNKGFKEPLNEDEVLSATASAEKAYKLWEDTFTKYLLLKDKPRLTNFFRQNGCYVYSNKKLISLLEITEVEMEVLSTIISTKEKNKRSKDYRNEWKKVESKRQRRNDSGLTSREQNKLNNLIRIIELKEKGVKQASIALELKITQQAVSKLYNEYKNNKLSSKLQAAFEEITNSKTKNINKSTNYEDAESVVDITSLDDLINF